MSASSRRTDETLDLSNDAAFTRSLLDDTHLWRQRLVEEFQFGSSDHVRVNSSYQLEFPRDLLTPFVGARPVGRIKALVPITTRAKRPLINPSFTGPAGEGAFLVLRASIAAIEAGYLAEAAASSPAALFTEGGLSLELLEAICLFTPAAFEEVRAHSASLDEALSRFLSRRLDFDVTASDVRRWLAMQRRSASALVESYGEDADPTSSSENVLLAMPWVSPRPGSVSSINVTIERYVDAVLARMFRALAV